LLWSKAISLDSKATLLWSKVILLENKATLLWSKVTLLERKATSPSDKSTSFERTEGTKIHLEYFFVDKTRTLQLLSPFLYVR